MVTSVVAGGAGFLGSHLVDALVKRREAVIVLDNLATGRLANLEAAISSGRTTFVYMDTAIESPSLRSALLSAGVRKIDFVYVLVPPPIAPSGDSMADRVAPSRSEFEALMELALEHGARFIFATAYEKSDKAPATEVPSVVTRSARQTGIDAVVAGIRKRGLDARIVKFATCYGPRNNRPDESFIAMLFDAALQRRPLPIEGTGQQICSMTYVKDAIDGLLMVAAEPQASLIPVEIVNTDERSAIDVARVLAKTAGAQFSIEHVPGPAQDQRASNWDLREATRLGWEPLTSLEDGLRKTYDWFAKEYRQYV